ncbi:hypothetical protein C493_00930 [Natronolimnohabitans innermongolicus JCM 12255]|uniref:Uncharacterized protein n=1 Tax=Natronolimnohabitans innermongolicus JCM 12255 TaxID=1227499 RepID=L9XK78_9EURY|nr:hypothetical protein C493_00930 [Natronolimnohabitans innermongolicus JCM 12255]
MVRSRTATALVGLLLGVVVSVFAWLYFETLLLFLFLPFVPFLFARGAERPSEAESEDQGVRRHKRCPACSFQTTDPSYEYCPRDGRRLRTMRE